MFRLVRTLLLISTVIISSVGIMPPAPNPAVAAPTTWYVATTGNDSNNCLTPTTPCATFARAIFNASPGGTIYAAVGIYIDVGEEVIQVNKNISLSGGWNSSFLSQIGRTTIDGQNARHGIVIFDGVTTSIDRFVIQNGSVPRYHFDYLGAGINNRGGNVVLTNSEVISNAAKSGLSYGSGGGIRNFDGNFTIINSTVARNYSNGTGAGIYIDNGNVLIKNSVISNNLMDACCSGGGGGGGIYHNNGNLTIEQSVIDSNYAPSGFPGSAIDSDGILTITNSSISRNFGSGTVIDNSNGTLYLNNSTIGQNLGIGIYNGHLGVLNTKNSIVADNTDVDCYLSPNAILNSFGYNLIESPGNCNLNGTDIIGIDPKLGILQGNPKHFPLLSGSPAINAGNPNGCTDNLGNQIIVDQIGTSRLGRCDIGAVESTIAFDKLAKGPFYPSGIVTYTLSLSNTTPSQNFSSVIMTDTLPSELVYVPGSLTATNGVASLNGNEIMWTGSVNAGNYVDVVFEMEIPTGLGLVGQTITNTAFFSWSSKKYIDWAVFTLKEKLYSLSKQVQGSFELGGRITYTISLENNDEAYDLTAVSLTDTLSSRLAYIPNSLIASNGNASIVNGNQIFWAGNLLGSTTSVITYATFISSINAGPITNIVESRWRNLVQTAGVQFTPISRVYLPLTSRNYCPNFSDDFSQNRGWFTIDQPAPRGTA